MSKAQPKSQNAIPPILKDAQWIWPESPHWDIHNCYSLFRRKFELKSVPDSAILYITADESYQLYVNGQYICRGPARGYQSSWPFDAVDISSWLQTGENLIAIRAYNPGESNFQYVHQGFAGLLLGAEIGELRLLSDGTWKSRRQTGVQRNTVPASVQLFPQEVIDLRIEPLDWCSDSYDDSDWDLITQKSTWNSLPWSDLEPRGIPMLKETIVPVGRMIGLASGQSATGYERTRNLAVTRFEEGLGHQPASSDASELSFDPTEQDLWQSVLIDMEKPNVGSVLLEIEGCRGGEIIETHHFETIDADSLTPDFDPYMHSRVACSQRLICRSGSNHHSFYHTYGFRYMVLTVRNNTHPITLRPTLRTTLYPHECTGSFQSSDSTLNEIWDICAWTEQICSMDAYVDTPWREQAQWWGDARVQAWNTFHLSGDTRLFRRGIRQIAGQTTPDDLTYGHAPTKAHRCVVPDFTLIWVLTCWDYYWQTGSLEPFREHAPQIEKALRYFENKINGQTGLLDGDERYWLFLDWTGLPKDGNSAVYSLWYLHTLDRVAQLHTLDDNHAAAKKYSAQASTLRSHLHKLLNSDGLLFDGYTPDGQVITETSIHAQTLALLTGLAPESEQTLLEKILVPYVSGQLKTKVQPSAYWITYLYSILAERGYGRQVVEHIRKHWTPMIAQGSTWENFVPRRAHQSFSHAWSAHPLFHLMQILGGSRQTAPGWSKVRFEPEFLGDSLETAVPTPLGMIHSAWKRSDLRIEGTLQIPEGMQGEFIVQGQRTEFTGLHHYSINEA